MHKLRRGHSQVGAHEHGRGRGCDRGESGDINAVPLTLIIPTPSIPEPSSSIPSPPSTPPALAAPFAPSVSSGTCPSLHSSTGCSSMRSYASAANAYFINYSSTSYSLLEFETIEEAKQSTPPLGLKYHVQHRSQVNKKNHENVPYSHYGGSKPFVYDLQEKSKEDMHQRRSQLCEEGFELVDENVIADEVLGTRAGYIPGMGYGPKPASYSRKRQPSPGTIALHERLSSLKDEYDSYRQQSEERMTILKEKYDSYRQQNEERMSKYEEDMSQIKSLYDKLWYNTLALVMVHLFVFLHPLHPLHQLLVDKDEYFHFIVVAFGFLFTFGFYCGSFCSLTFVQYENLYHICVDKTYSG
nr:uncharacterized protein LOC125421548 [Ziziphus jujuba var. spinosa]